MVPYSDLRLYCTQRRASATKQITMAIKDRYHLISCWFSNWSRRYLEVSIHDRDVWWGSFLYDLFNLYYFRWVSDSTCRIHYWPWITKRCYFSVFILCSWNTMAYHRDYWYDYIFYSTLLLQCHWGLDFILHGQDSEWGLIWSF